MEFSAGGVEIVRHIDVENSSEDNESFMQLVERREREEQDTRIPYRQLVIDIRQLKVGEWCDDRNMVGTVNQCAKWVRIE